MPADRLLTINVQGEGMRVDGHLDARGHHRYQDVGNAPRPERRGRCGGGRFT